jgi:general secretion pathway protein G
MQARSIRATARGGFTLMELLVVVAILVVLAGAAVPIYMTYLDQAKKSTAWTNAKTLSTVCETYKITNGQYPGSLHELAHPSDGSKPLVEEVTLLDPWKREYGYDPAGPHSTVGKPDIWSTGENGNEQIGNWLTSPPK